MTSKKECPTGRGRGRPRSFDRDAALRAAISLFWERGYEGTSFDDLVAAMGVSASSFYNSFGSKETLYLEAIYRYAQDASVWFKSALVSDLDTRVAFANLLEAGAVAFTDENSPAGCMIGAAATQCAPSHNRLRDMLGTLRQAAEQAMVERLQQGINRGDLPRDTDIETLAAFYSAVLRGMSLQARDGMSRDKLLRIGHFIVAQWPGRSTQTVP